MTTQEWKALGRMVKGKDPMIISSKEGKVMLEYISGTMERYELTIPLGTIMLYEDSTLTSRSRKYLKELYDTWYTWIREGAIEYD